MMILTILELLHDEIGEVLWVALEEQLHHLILAKLLVGRG